MNNTFNARRIQEITRSLETMNSTNDQAVKRDCLARLNEAAVSEGWTWEKTKFGWVVSK